jgi:hypothetical protein
VVFVARLQDSAIGFTQLYPCFASVSLARIMLQTAVTNLPAQRLYAREGWVRDNDFYVCEYHLATVSRA